LATLHSEALAPEGGRAPAAALHAS
jgi:hypothetical protein